MSLFGCFISLGVCLARELERSPPQVCYMKCELKPSNYSALYQWVAVNESKSAEQEKSKKDSRPFSLESLVFTASLPGSG